MNLNKIITLIAALCLSLSAVAQNHEISKSSLPHNPFGNPLIPDMIGDPSIIEIDGTFYCYVTTDGYGRGLETSGPPVVWKSKDFKHWSFEGTYFPQAENEKYWAPSKPVLRNGKWYIYPTVNGYMYPAVAESPDGPFRLVKGDTFTLPNRLLEQDSVCAIDTEIFIDDDHTPYAIWGLRNVARLKEDMATIDTLVTITTRKKSYTEGPIFFKRNGIYYFLYTNMALEKYEYFYQMSHVSPFGPYITPEQDRVCATNAERGVFGPGHGCVFRLEGTDDYYLAYLEFSRNSTNRQVYVNRLEFNADGTIRQVDVSLDGVGALRPQADAPRRLMPLSVTASSVAAPHQVPYKLDKRCQRTEYFVPDFAADDSNGSRWMATESDTTDCWLMLDLGDVRNVGVSKLAFVRPTQGHTYLLEGSTDGKQWTPCGGHADVRKMSPHTDSIDMPLRYLRVKITSGIRGVWEWIVEEAHTKDFAGARWIAMDADSTILFPHIHLLKARSEQARSLNPYRLPVFSKNCLLDGKVKKAWVDICGMGQYELSIDGRKVGDYFLSPGWTRYDKEMLYNSYDVTSLLRKSKDNTIDIRVMLGGGMYDIPVEGYHKMAGSCGAPKLLFKMTIDYADGSRQTVVSDETWQVAESGVRYSSIYAGEWFDAAHEGESKPVILTRPRWHVPLMRQAEGTQIKVHSELHPTLLRPGLYDMRQNCSGIVRIRVKGEKGKTITLRPAEILKNGKISQRSLPGYEWKYTLRGDEKGETWQPQFTYTGFRYIAVTADEGVELERLTGLHTTTDAPEVGSFECSDTLFNQIHSLIDWAIRSNLVSITTDCPTREKLGWQEQNHLMAYSMMYRYDMRALMNKIADDLAASQHADGAIPTIAPEFTMFEPGSGFEDTPEWGASFILCPWYTYLWYGDDTAMRKHYYAMRRYIFYLTSRAEGGILDYGLGDWFDMGPNRPGKAQLTSVALTATAMYYYDLTVMHRIALHLGKTADAQWYADVAAEVKRAFNAKFLTADDRVYENGSQAGLSMALYMHLADDTLRTQALDALVRDIEKRGYALTAGDVGYRYVVQALQQAGRGDVLHKMNSNASVPSYAYQLKKGATALTESWQAYDNVSNNHLMLGHLMEWLYGGLGGITFRETDPEGASMWKRCVIAPQMVGDITWAKTSLMTPLGQVSCHWLRRPERGKWSIKITVPHGAEAEVHLPDGRVVIAPEGHHRWSGKVKTER